MRKFNRNLHWVIFLIQQIDKKSGSFGHHVAHLLSLSMYYLGKLSKPIQVSPFLILSSSSRISSSVWPLPFTIFQKSTNSSYQIYPSWLQSTVLKNSFAEIFPKFLDQCFIASSLSIVLEPSLSNILKTSSIIFIKSALSSSLFTCLAATLPFELCIKN